MPDPRSILYLFAHQDDELLILPKLLQSVRAGHSVEAVWITDGRKGGNPAKRQAESREVMRRAGVPQDHLHFLNFPDTRSINHLAAIDQHVQQLVSRYQPTEVTSLAFEGGNMDHDVAALLAAQIKRRASPPIAQYEYPLYNKLHGRRQIGQFLPNSPSPVHTIPLTDQTRELMEQAFKVYRTQRLGLWLLSIGGQKKKLLTRGVLYRDAPDYDFLQRPANEPCEYETSWTHRGRWADWLAAVGKFLSQ